MLMVLEQTTVGFRTIDIKKETKLTRKQPSISRSAADVQDEGVFVGRAAALCGSAADVRSG